MTRVAGLTVGDPAPLWDELGFDVAAGACRVGTVLIELDPAAGPGVSRWRLVGAEPVGGGPAPGGRGRVDGLDTQFAAAGSDGTGFPSAPAAAHANGVTHIDHLVVNTPDLDRTVAALGGLGLVERRRRQPDAARPVPMAFFRMAEVILEVVGPPADAADAELGPARFWGLTFAVADLDATAALLGDRLRPSRRALQPGRRIAVVDRAVGSSVPIAFMSPDPDRPPRAVRR